MTTDLITIGIDEVGRGCLAGPVAACAFYFQPGASVAGLTDSKKLSARQREKLEQQIMAAGHYGFGEASNVEVDALGIVNANYLAMRRALEALQLDDFSRFAIIVDGNQVPPLDRFGAGSVRCLIKADSLIPEVSAASILAKVRRDRYMAEVANRYPGYGFEKHVGYGSAAHLAALRTLGPCDLHRMTFRPIAPPKETPSKVKLRASS